MAQVENEPGRILTQVITRPTTTYTAFVTLGVHTSGAVSPVVPPPAEPTLIQDSGGASVAPATSSSPSGLTSAQLGAILGGVFGFIILLLALCYCAKVQRERRRIEHRSIYWDRETVSQDSIVVEDRWTVRHGRDPWVRQDRIPHLEVPPPRFPPKRYTPYTQTPHRQFPGTQIYP